MDISPEKIDEKMVGERSEPVFYPVEMLGLLRSLDMIFWSLAAFYIIFISTFQEIDITLFPYLSTLPLFCITYSVMKISDKLFEEKKKGHLTRLKVWALVLSFNYPFFVFLQFSESNYILACSLIALLAFYQFLFCFTRMAKELSNDQGEPVLAKESGMASYLIFLSIALLCSYVFFLFKFPLELQQFFSVGKLGLALKAALLILIVFPLLLPLTILFRLKLMVGENYKDKVRKL